MSTRRNFPYETGVIHGRFQVLHNDHLNYLMSGKLLCRHLVVGITNPEPLLTREEQADRHRSDNLANPLTYYERYLMIKTVLLEQGLAPRTFSVVPLPINFPERYHHYVPMDAIFFVAIYDAWGSRKLKYFKTLGLRTHVLREVPLEEKGLSASTIRRSMINGSPWTHLVPPGAAALLTQWDVAARLKKLEREKKVET